MSIDLRLPFILMAGGFPHVSFVFNVDDILFFQNRFKNIVAPVPIN